MCGGDGEGDTTSTLATLAGCDCGGLLLGREGEDDGFGFTNSELEPAVDTDSELAGGRRDRDLIAEARNF